ncbi:MAG TPA: DinB family protein [Candidatus Methylomirabilis sp.]|nr:DinB family protein [Candidatus Methylomirabilis sp.]
MPERALIELLYGKGAHANPVACVEDVSLELSGRRAEGFPHSIWQLVSHMNYWMDYEVRRIRGEAPKYPHQVAESWPTNAAPSGGDEWKKTISEFRDLLGTLAALAESSAGELARPIAATHPDHAKHASTLRDVLWQTLVHNSYHVGQTAMLRRMLGAWPPRGGGDTW